jgi:chromosome segregation ATPase
LDCRPCGSGWFVSRIETALALAKLEANGKWAKLDLKACEKIKTDSKAVATKAREAAMKHAQVVQEKSALERELAVGKKKITSLDGIADKLKFVEKSVKDLGLGKACAVTKKKLESAQEQVKKLHSEKTELTASIQTKDSELASISSAAKHKDSLGELKAECDKLLAARNDLQLKVENASKKLADLETEAKSEKAAKAELVAALKATEKSKADVPHSAHSRRSTPSSRSLVRNSRPTWPPRRTNSSRVSPRTRLWWRRASSHSRR